MQLFRRLISGSLLLIFCSIIIAGCLSCVSRTWKPSAMVHSPGDQESRVVKIHTTCFGEKYRAGSGSGTLISSGRVLTAAHVVACDEGEISDITLSNAGENIPMVAVLVDRDHDVAIIVPMEPFKVIQEVSPIVVGAPPWDASTEKVCYAAAVPMYDYRCGLLEYKRNAMSADLIITTPVVPGNSGSGLYDSHGRLIGVVVVYRGYGGQIMGGGATSIWRLRELLQL